MTPEMIELLLTEGINAFQAYQTQGMNDQQAKDAAIADCRERYAYGDDELEKAVQEYRQKQGK